MTTTNVPRVNFFDKQFLRVDEFRDEQLYHIASRRRHNIAQHSWGIISGLEVAQDENSALVVLPGMAIDGYGRELLLTEKKQLAVETFELLGTERLDVWLVYDRRDGESAPDGYGGCGSNGGASVYRSQEIPQVLLERAVGSRIDARRPPGVPAAVLDSKVPLISDDPKDTWRVYLGRITRLPDNFVIDLTQRPYVGLVGEVVDHPANPSRVEIGKLSTAEDTRTLDGVTYKYASGEDAKDKSSARRFAVFVPEEVEDGAEGTITLLPRFEVRQEGIMRVRGRTILNGNLRVSDGAVQFLNPTTITENNLPTEPSIYRAKETERTGSGSTGADDGNSGTQPDSSATGAGTGSGPQSSGSSSSASGSGGSGGSGGGTGGGSTGSEERIKDELRIDLGSVDTLNREFVIGFSKDDGSFTTCLKLEFVQPEGSDAEPTVKVTINGDLKLNGEMRSGNNVPRVLSQEVFDNLLTSFQSGVAAGNSRS